MDSVDTQWMPATGLHTVSLGSSLSRALKARKGGAPPKRSNLPDRDFYSFRYNFKPESIDPDRPGSVEVRRGKDSTSVTLERPSTQHGEHHLFKGSEQPVKEYECVLLYDEELGTFTLEKIDGLITFSYERKVQAAGTNPPHESSSPQVSSSQTRDDLDKELGELLDTEDADGDPDDFEEVLAPVAIRKEEEEEEDDYLLGTLAKPPSPIRAPDPPPKQKVPRPSKKQESVHKPKPAPKEAPRHKKEPEADRMVDSVLVEELDPGVLPTRPAKRHKPAPTTSLALPGGLPELPSSRLPQTAQEDSDPDDWESVPVDVSPEENEFDIDPDEFGREMELELGGSQEDGSSEPETTRRPMSLNQFAGGQFSDVTSSSSEETDDE